MTKRALLVLGFLGMMALGCEWARGAGEIPAYDAGKANGDKICHDFALGMQQTSSNWAVAAWIAGIAGTLASVAGGALGMGKEGDKFPRRAAGVLIASLGGALAAGSAYCVARSNAASDAGGSATRARTQEKDIERFKACLEARAHWLESRSASLDHSPPPSPEKTDDRQKPAPKAEHRD